MNMKIYQKLFLSERIISTFHSHFIPFSLLSKFSIDILLPLNLKKKKKLLNLKMKCYATFCIPTPTTTGAPSRETLFLVYPQFSETPIPFEATRGNFSAETKKGSAHWGSLTRASAAWARARPGGSSGPRVCWSGCPRWPGCCRGRHRGSRLPGPGFLPLSRGGEAGLKKNQPGKSISRASG